MLSRFPMRIVLGVLAVLAFPFVPQARAALITLNFSNLDSTDVNFPGNSTFNFTSNISGYQFSITTVNNGVGDSVGLEGYVTPGGPFTIGLITPLGSGQTAPVTGTSTLHITDSHADDLTGTIQWNNITTLGVGGIINLTGSINLTNLAYSGTNSDLNALASAGSAVDAVTFQFVPAETLTQLATTPSSTSYSGTIAAVPEPASAAVAGLACLGLLAFRPRRKFAHATLG